MQCVALKPNGERCTARGRHFEGYCGTHFNSKMSKDATFSARFRAHDEPAYNEYMRKIAEREELQRVQREANIVWFDAWRARIPGIDTIFPPAHVPPAAVAGVIAAAVAAAAIAPVPAAAPAVVRDPVGGIDLRAFATDSQNVHRASVQSAAERTIATIVSRPLPAGQDTLEEVMKALLDKTVIPYPIADRVRIITAVSTDYTGVKAFDTKYSTLLDHVWAFIRSHKERNSLCLRLAQEVKDGIGMCSNGKMARLTNVLQGFDETLEPEPPRELFQTRIALLLSRPLAERETAARALFDEFKIPADEHAVWLEPLLDE